MPSDSSDPMVKGGNGLSLTKKRAICIIVSLLAGLFLVIGIVIGRFVICPTDFKGDGVFLPGIPSAIIQDADPAISDIILNAIKAENIRQYLKYVCHICRYVCFNSSITLGWQYFLYTRVAVVFNNT